MGVYRGRGVEMTRANAWANDDELPVSKKDVELVAQKLAELFKKNPTIGEIVNLINDLVPYWNYYEEIVEEPAPAVYYFDKLFTQVLSCKSNIDSFGTSEKRECDYDWIINVLNRLQCIDKTLCDFYNDTKADFYKFVPDLDNWDNSSSSYKQWRGKFNNFDLE